MVWKCKCFLCIFYTFDILTILSRPQFIIGGAWERVPEIMREEILGIWGGSVPLARRKSTEF